MLIKVTAKVSPINYRDCQDGPLFGVSYVVDGEAEYVTICPENKLSVKHDETLCVLVVGRDTHIPYAIKVGKQAQSPIRVDKPSLYNAVW